jgi:SAM-dependent methyltransferase
MITITDTIRTTNFDEFADLYGNTTSNMMRKYIERPSFLDVLGGVWAKSVLDLACGEGNYARIVKKRGAAHVMGVDISEGMIARARLIEAQQPLNIQYEVGDAIKLEQIGLFDIIAAIYLLPHAYTQQDLEGMARSIYHNLKPGGRLVAVTSNPDITARHLAAPQKYDVCVEVEGPIVEGAQLVVTYPNVQNGCSIRILNYHWSKETYERILKEVGFQKIIWHPMRVSTEGIKRYGLSYWQDYLATPHLTVLECYK